MPQEEVEKAVQEFIESGKQRSYLNDNNWTTHEIEEYGNELRATLSHFIHRSEIEKLARDIDNFQLHKFTHLNEIGAASLTKHQIADYVRSLYKH